MKRGLESMVQERTLRTRLGACQEVSGRHWEKGELRTKRKRPSLKASKEQHIVFYSIRGLYSVFRGNKLLTVFFFFPLMAPRVQLSRSKTSTSVHCCAVTTFICVLISFR